MPPCRKLPPGLPASHHPFPPRNVQDGFITTTQVDLGGRGEQRGHFSGHQGIVLGLVLSYTGCRLALGMWDWQQEGT